jgi:DNA mismatch repair protein MutH
VHTPRILLAKDRVRFVGDAVAFVVAESRESARAGAEAIEVDYAELPVVASLDAALAADYDEIMGLVGIGRIEDVTAHLGEHLQIRPKARDGSARTLTFGREGEHISTVPRGFYLRTRFTEHVLNSR